MLPALRRITFVLSFLMLLVGLLSILVASRRHASEVPAAKFEVLAKASLMMREIRLAQIELQQIFTHAVQYEDPDLLEYDAKEHRERQLERLHQIEENEWLDDAERIGLTDEFERYFDVALFATRRVIEAQANPPARGQSNAADVEALKRHIRVKQDFEDKLDRLEKGSRSLLWSCFGDLRAAEHTAGTISRTAMSVFIAAVVLLGISLVCRTAERFGG